MRMKGSQMVLPLVSLLVAVVVQPACSRESPTPKTTPTAAEVERCPGGMVRVPAGKFQMGDPEGKGQRDERPVRTVTLSGYCIDRTEVTVAAYEACVMAKGCAPAPLTVAWSRFTADAVKQLSRYCNRSDRPDHPINCVDWYQAAAYCKWVGKRLPTEAEWEYAARGSDGRTYPWGDEAPSPKLMNACGSECVALGEHEMQEKREAMYDADDGWATTAPPGSVPAGASPFGALDMVGNVWEWTADWYGPYSEAGETNPKGARTSMYRVLRGSGYLDSRPQEVRAANRLKNEPSNRWDFAGFRCAHGD
jgi:formylglycine-generating enzyme required for sulfatase activity